MRADITVLVLDTNIVLDLFVYDDPATQPLRAALEAGVCWHATAAMRDELVRVLTYPQIVRRLQVRAWGPEEVLRRFDAQVRMTEVAPKAPCTCKDPDDQKFIDLAAAHQAVLLSKDAAVLCMERRLARLGARVSRCWPPSEPAV